MAALPRVALLAASPRVAPPLASPPPVFRLAILLASPLATPRMVHKPWAARKPPAVHKPWAARKPLAPQRLAVRTIGLMAASLIRGKTMSTLVARRRLKGKLEASLMSCQVAQVLAWQQ